jgi:hypothetical protein
MSAMPTLEPVSTTTRPPRSGAPQGGRHQIGTPAGFGSEQVAGFRLECMAGFVGIRIGVSGRCGTIHGILELSAAKPLISTG